MVNSQARVTNEKVLKMEDAIKSLGADEYLRLEELTSVRHEFVDGELYAMTGGTMAHSLITTNIGTSLKSQLKASGCRVYISNLKVRIDATNSFYYPDVLVDCGHYVKDKTFTTSPVLIVEVLSRSTAAIDQREKLFAYKKIDSLKAYIMIQQSRARVAIHLRGDEDTWTKQEVDKDGYFTIEVCPGTNIKIHLNEIYDDCNLDADNLQVQEESAAYVW